MKESIYGGKIFRTPTECVHYLNALDDQIKPSQHSNIILNEGKLLIDMCSPLNCTYLSISENTHVPKLPELNCQTLGISGNHHITQIPKNSKIINLFLNNTNIQDIDTLLISGRVSISNHIGILRVSSGNIFECSKTHIHIPDKNNFNGIIFDNCLIDSKKIISKECSIIKSTFWQNCVISSDLIEFKHQKDFSKINCAASEKVTVYNQSNILQIPTTWEYKELIVDTNEKRYTFRNNKELLEEQTLENEKYSNEFA